MQQNQLGSATTLELLIELMYAGKSGIVPDLQALEPISVDDIVSALESRHAGHLGSSFDTWYAWFQGPSSPATKEDRDTLFRLKDFKDKSDPLFKRARERPE